jgi:glycosyltransferase involved in cell wall biosynthesis
MKEPLVSIIITTYNWNRKWLSESLDSVLNQTYKNIEIIIVNDASTNNIEETIKDYQLKHKNIFYLKNEKNLWVSKSSNKWIKQSKWKYIARIDDDDIWNDETKLEKQVKFMEENPDYGLCWVEYTIVINEEWKEIDKWKNITNDKDIRQHILQRDPFTHSSILFSREAADKVWLYNEEYRAALDYEIICKIWSIYKFCNIEGISMTYRINTKWISKSKHKLQYRNARKIFRKNRNNYPNFYIALIYRILVDIILPERVIKFLVKIKNIFK